MTNTVDLLHAVCDHLAEFALPTISSVHVAASIPPPQITIQLPCHEPSHIARTLLAWADTLTDVTASAWRVPHGDSAHLSVTGLLPRGIAVQIYGGIWVVTEPGLGADLAPNATTTIPLAALRHAATAGRVTA
jgi:hypothetical protein